MLPILMIGSGALRAAGVHMDRKVLDFDFIATPEAAAQYIRESISVLDLKPGQYKVMHSQDAKYLFFHRGPELPVIEFELAWPNTTALELLKKIGPNYKKLTVREAGYPFAGLSIEVASPRAVYMLKMSHRFKKNSIHFLKTMRDIQMLRAAGYGKLPMHMTNWFKDRVRETYSYNHPKLQGVSKADFFKDDGINYVYDHDAIHWVVKHFPDPAYSYFQPEGEEIGTSKAEFFKSTRIIQLLAVLEECYVLSLERAIIPFNLWGDKVACRKAFETALAKVCTSITSGWFRAFAWDNYDIVLGLYDAEYVSRFKAQADLGLVKLHNSEEK